MRLDFSDEQLWICCLHFSDVDIDGKFCSEVVVSSAGFTISGFFILAGDIDLLSGLDVDVEVSLEDDLDLMDFGVFEVNFDFAECVFVSSVLICEVDFELDGYTS